VTVEDDRGVASAASLRKRFGQGLTPNDFKASFEDGGARLNGLAERVIVDGNTAFAALERDLNVLAIVEGGCRDSLEGSSVLLRLTEGNPRVHIRFFRREENPDLMAAYRKDGLYDSIPVFVFLDRDFNELGRYVERPAEVGDLFESHRATLAEQHPEFAPADAELKSFDAPVKERLRSALDDLRERDRPTANGHIVRALSALVAKAADASRTASRPKAAGV
jgi:hypothetical protein